MTFILIGGGVVVIGFFAAMFPKCDVCRCWSGFLLQDMNGVKRCQSCSDDEHRMREEIIAENNAALRESWADVKE